MPDPIRIAPTPLDHLEVPLQLTLSQLHYVLAVLAKRPLEEVFGVFSALQAQGNAAVDAAREPKDAGVAPPTSAIEPLVLDREAFLRGAVDDGATSRADRANGSLLPRDDTNFVG